QALSDRVVTISSMEILLRLSARSRRFLQCEGDSMNHRLVLLILLAFAASATFGQNNRSAVSLTGSDMASCTVPDPCRTFDVAISKTNSGGEVVVLSTAGYGPFTVTKSVSIISPPAYHAAMAPTSGTAITVNAP